MNVNGILAFILSHWAILVVFALGIEAVLLAVAKMLAAIGLAKPAHYVVVASELFPQAVSFVARLLGKPVPSFASPDTAQK